MSQVLALPYCLTIGQHDFEFYKRAELLHLIEVNSGWSDKKYLPALRNGAPNGKSPAEGRRKRFRVLTTKTHIDRFFGAKLIGSLVGDEFTRSVRKLAYFETSMRDRKESIGLMQDFARNRGERCHPGPNRIEAMGRGFHFDISGHLLMKQVRIQPCD